MWEELANDKGNRHHNGCIDDGIFQHQVHTVEFACSIVVACNRLHTLTNAHHHHHKQKGDTVDNTVGSYGEVASMRLQTLVDENHHEARTKLHAERRNANLQNVVDNAFLQSINASFEVDRLFRIAEYDDHVSECYDLCQDSGNGSTTYAES